MNIEGLFDKLFGGLMTLKVDFWRSIVEPKGWLIYIALTQFESCKVILVRTVEAKSVMEMNVWALIKAASTFSTKRVFVSWNGVKLKISDDETAEFKEISFKTIWSAIACIKAVLLCSWKNCEEDIWKLLHWRRIHCPSSKKASDSDRPEILTEALLFKYRIKVPEVSSY